MWSDLDNKTILVTGAGHGIGNALCRKLALSGARVYALSKSGLELAELHEKFPIIKPIQVNLERWPETIQALGGVPKLDGLVNNAGIAIIKKFDDIEQKDIDETFNINFKAAYNVTQSLLPKYKPDCSIVMVSSIASSRAFADHSVYSASKAAIDSLTRSLALELAPRKIRVNSVNPTVVLTQMGRDNWSDPKKAKPLLEKIPMRRFCEVDEVLDAIGFLLSKKSSFLTGQHINVDGGLSAV